MAPPRGLLASEDAAVALGMPVRMRLASFAFVGVEPEVMGIGPVPATEKALAKAGLTIEDIGLFEAPAGPSPCRSSPSSTTSASPTTTRVNEYGGAIAVGHPLASSGVRLMTQLARQFKGTPRCATA